MITIKFFHDPGHGWLQVPRLLIELMPRSVTDKISRYSYMDTLHVYLEEDCDADLFHEWMSEAKAEFVLKSIYHENESPIRRMDRYDR